MKVSNNENNYLITIKEDPYTLVLTFSNPRNYGDIFRGYRRFKITNDFEEFALNSDLILANRVDDKLKSLKTPIFTRDIYNIN